MALVIAITGRKGGIGKSTITGNLAGEFFSLGLKVRVLDTDPQQSLWGWAQMGSGLLRGITSAVETTHPASFKKAVSLALEQADVVLIDTPPAFADPALLAALLADVVLLPAGPSPLDIMAAKDALELIQEAASQRGDGKPHIYFVPSKTNARASLSRDLPETLGALGASVLPGVTQRTVVAEAALTGLTVAEYAKNSLARAEFKALALTLKKVFYDNKLKKQSKTNRDDKAVKQKTIGVRSPGQTPARSRSKPTTRGKIGSRKNNRNASA